jgi:hypothetical protein
MDNIKYQNHELKKTNEQYEREKNENGFMEKLYLLYNDMFGKKDYI